MFHKIIFLSAGLLIAGSTFAADTLGGQWRGNANLALSKSSGNTDSSTFSAAVDEVRATAADKISAYASSLYGSSNGVKNNDKTRLGVRYDYNLSPQLFGFGLGDLERDSIANLQLRTSLGGGLGYHVIQTATTTFDVFGGLAYSKANMIVGADVSGAELLLGEESTHKLSDTVRFKQKLIYYPSLKHGGQYRSIFDAGLVVDISSSIGLSVGLQNKHATDVAPGVKHSDTFLLTGLNFKLQ